MRPCVDTCLAPAARVADPTPPTRRVPASAVLGILLILTLPLWTASPTTRTGKAQRPSSAGLTPWLCRCWDSEISYYSRSFGATSRRRGTKEPPIFAAHLLKSRPCERDNETCMLRKPCHMLSVSWNLPSRKAWRQTSGTWRQPSSPPSRETTHSGSPERAHNGPPPGNDCNKSFGGCSYKSLAGDFTTRMSPDSWPPSSWTTPNIWDTCTPFKPCGHCYLQPSEAAFSNGTTNMQHGNRDTTRPCSRSRRHRRRQRLQKPQRLQDQRPQCRRTWKFRYLRRKTKHDIRRRRRPRAHRTGRHRELRHYRRYVQDLLRNIVAYGWSESVFYISGCSGPKSGGKDPQSTCSTHVNLLADVRVEDAPGRGSSEATIAHPTAPTRAKLYDHFPQASRSKGIAPKPETAPRLTAPSLPPLRLSWFLRLLVILGHQGSVCAAPPVWRSVPCHQDRTEQILIQPSRVVKRSLRRAQARLQRDGLVPR